ncbi:longevity assurance proteins LAG1/LAC1 [Daldinia loculata]|uniref:longevity assurance proteins LAG1/LAC1 n=1 Tax=Daldinia loculata TaxID=103429 RepID=UPI0020C234B7|nr:longevity assurance proteins LAG1/LAC1 [Daldinia loculata]KAI1650891.1 longevity assurance proteins LAG1/LAC1 [Daldinia loculata]
MNEPEANAPPTDLGDTTKSTTTMEPQVEKPKTSAARPPVKSRSSMNGPLYMQTSKNKVLVRRVKRKDDGPMRGLARWFLENQTGLSFNLITLIFLTHICLPKARPHTSKFFTLSYYNPESGKYSIGTNDYHFISFCIVLFTGLRACLMEHILSPLARQWGISKRKDITRFSEQAWMLVYYSVFWTVGTYLYVNSAYFLNMKELWTGWPNRELDGLMKGYILAQWAFWVQQVLVIHMEDRRKDHYQMLTHHFITITLISGCYYYCHTRVGNLILVLMDVVDLFLPLAKCLKYLGFSKLCDATFVVFMVSWFVARHIFYLMTCYSIYKDLPEQITWGCYRGPNSNLTGPLPIPDGWGHVLEPFNGSEGTVCFSSSIQWGFLNCLLGLQVLTIFWFFMIINVAIRVVKGDGADDTRSDDERDENELETEYEEAQPLEEEVGVEAIDLKGWERRTGVKRGASSSGVSLPGHSDRKELLGRIGCEKQVD